MSPCLSVHTSPFRIACRIGVVRIFLLMGDPLLRLPSSLDIMTDPLHPQILAKKHQSHTQSLRLPSLPQPQVFCASWRQQSGGTEYRLDVPVGKVCNVSR
jgi:hypothetical protein